MATAGIVRGGRTLSLMPTYRCPAACQHCASMSGPDVTTTLTREIVLDAIRQAAELEFYNVVFTGGEATLRRDDLLAGLRLARDLGLPTRLVTNAHWATSPDAARKMLDALIAAGLDEINYSTGDEHARFIPVDRVVLAAAVAAEREFRSLIVVEVRRDRVVNGTTIREHELLRALPEDRRKLVTIIESPWMPLDPADIAAYPDGATSNRLNFSGHLPCDDLLRVYTVQADGRVGACCGIGMKTIPELSVATVAEPDFLRRAIEEAESDLLKLWIHFKGPEQVLAWAATHDPTIDWEGSYAHHCQACARLYRDPAVRRVIREHYLEIVPEVLAIAQSEKAYARRMQQA